jgi:hypothetical protein
MVPRALVFRFHGPDGFETGYAGPLAYFAPVTAASSGNLAPKAGDERGPLAVLSR